ERGESGELWKEPDQTLENVKAIRHGEAERAAAALGATFRCLDFGDYPLEVSGTRLAELVDAVREAAPDVILTHTDRDPFNPDHPAAFVAVERAALGSATVHEAAGRTGVVDVPLIQIPPGSRAAGPARTVRCGQGDNLMVHAAMAATEPGDVLVLTMPEPEPVALIGELLATQAKARGAVAVLVDAAVRDVEELAGLGLPVWARYVRVSGATKEIPGE